MSGHFAVLQPLPVHGVPGSARAAGLPAFSHIGLRHLTVVDQRLSYCTLITCFVNVAYYTYVSCQDISQYCNRCPCTVYPEAPVPQVFQLFRSMGLRHLPVVDHDGKVRHFRKCANDTIKRVFSRVGISLCLRSEGRCP